MAGKRKLSSKPASKSKRSTKRRDFKAEYVRRIKNAAKKGKTRQQARGHKPKEHIARREREKQELAGLTRDQVKSIRTWYDAKFNKRSYEGVPSVEDVIDFARDRSFSEYSLYKKIWNKARDTYLTEKQNETYVRQNYGYLLHLVDLSKVRPEGEDQWLYYH